MRRYFFLMWSLCAPFVTVADDTLSIKRFTYVPPQQLSMPVWVDSVEFTSESKFDTASLFRLTPPFDATMQPMGTVYEGAAIPAATSAEGCALASLSFTLTTSSFAKGRWLTATMPRYHRWLKDGEAYTLGEVTLEPGTHTFTLQYLAGKADSLRLQLVTKNARVTAGLPGEGEALYNVDQMMQAHLVGRVSLSPSGAYLLLTERQRAAGGDRRQHFLIERATGRRIRLSEAVRWMPRTDRYFYTREEVTTGRTLYAVSPATGHEDRLATHLPEGEIFFIPTEDRFLLEVPTKGPVEKNNSVYEVLNPEDRQPHWRDRQTPYLYDLQRHTLTPLTFGHSPVYLLDVTDDGDYLLLMKSIHGFEPSAPRERPRRPHDAFAFYRVSLRSLAVDTLVAGDGFLSSAQFSPDGQQVLFIGSPEAFGRVGCVLPDDKTPSMYDYQAYIMDLKSRVVEPITRDFRPSLERAEWSHADQCIYFTANNSDSISLYRYQPKTKTFSRLALTEENVTHFTLSQKNPLQMVYSGQSAMNSDRLYAVNLGSATPTRGSILHAKEQLLYDYSADNLQGTAVATCQRFTAANAIGDSVLCRYYLPVGYRTLEALNASGRHWPMITYYYGGCSPTERIFESSYPWQCWASAGYVVLVVQPSGAAGFGQEWSARHVATAGEDPARDIFASVRAFCEACPAVDSARIGCCGASYGGFMTQYMLTLPDCPFACAISHAGISDHTTYWGYGYWGYSYSEVSMGVNYPWSNPNLYVDHSPIYRADQIHTPILFLHGTKDVNVPINNSIQLFTALKLLGRETAMVCVEGEDHGIKEYKKRLLWLKTSLAWFERYLKDDSTWWDTLYPPKNL